jgi:hypothetical protein
MEEMMTTECLSVVKKYVKDGDCLLAQKWLKLLVKRNAYKCRYVYWPLTSLSVTATCFVRGSVKMIYKQRRIKAFPQRKCFTMDSSARSHWRNKIFTKKTSVLFAILPGHNSPPLPAHTTQFTPSLPTALPKAATLCHGTTNSHNPDGVL